jgi:hypothetical protein
MKHSKYHVKSEFSFKCILCNGVKFSSIQKIKKHLSNYHCESSKQFKCKICEYIILNESKIEKHLKNHLRENIPVDCMFCNLKINSISNFKSHLKRKHQNESDLTNFSDDNEENINLNININDTNTLALDNDKKDLDPDTSSNPEIANDENLILKNMLINFFFSFKRKISIFFYIKVFLNSVNYEL